MNYYVYMDESGDHGLSKIDPSFPVFVLCAVIFSESSYEEFRASFNTLKERFWGDRKVIMHSRDIRKCEKEFKILLDYEVKSAFYSQLDQIVETSNYTIISVGINKEEYIKRYGRISKDPYEIALSYIIERVVFLMDSFKDAKSVKILIEKRGKKEDAALARAFEMVKSRGTFFVSGDRMRAYNLDIDFKDKKDNLNGMQLADLVAYPIARYIMDQERANPAFEMLKGKLYQNGGKIYGLKIFP